VALGDALIAIIPCAAGPRPFDVANLPHDRIAVDKRLGAAGKGAAVARKRNNHFLVGRLGSVGSRRRVTENLPAEGNKVTTSCVGSRSAQLVVAA